MLTVKKKRKHKRNQEVTTLTAHNWHLDHILAKFEQNRMTQNVQNFNFKKYKSIKRLKYTFPAILCHKVYLVKAVGQKNPIILKKYDFM